MHALSSQGDVLCVLQYNTYARTSAIQWVNSQGDVLSELTGLYILSELTWRCTLCATVQYLRTSQRHPMGSQGPRVRVAVVRLDGQAL